MHTLKIKKTIIRHAVWALFGGVLIAPTTVPAANSDMKQQEKVLRAQEATRHQGMEHSAKTDESALFRGVFYGYLPCERKGCDGIKMTLSLKQKNNYLLVTQYTMESAREYYEKGKYVWDEQSHRLELTPNKDAGKRYFTIQDEATLLHLSGEGRPLPGNQDDYLLRRSDTAYSRDVHMH